MKLYKWVLLLSVFCCGLAQAQFLPNNTELNVQSVQRWMDSNRDLSSIVQAVDAMHSSDADLKLFDALPAAEQDQRINQFLQKKNMLQAANTIAIGRGWKSVGEYMRLSSKLGNAIAAYFLADSMANLNAEQKKSLRDKADPAVLAVPAADISFVKANEKLLKQYIQAYSQGN